MARTHPPDPAGFQETTGPRRGAASFLVLPLLFLFLVLLQGSVVGPYYLAPNYDPEYVYLLNGLNLALLQSPEHIDHPGTPLQLLLGLAIRIVNSGVEPGQTAANVLGHAESYLSAANLALVGLYALALAWAGAAVAARTGQRVAGWLVQATPFLLGDQLLLMLRVNPEPVVLLASLTLAPWLLASDPSAAGWKKRLLPAFVVATGLCTKITFLPVLVAFLLVERGWNRRLQSALWVVGFSLLWTIPIWAKYERVIAWFWGLAARQGPYGLGPSGMVSPVSLGSGVTQLLVDNPLYLASLVAGIATLAALRWGRAWDRVRAESSVRVLVGLLVGGCIQLLMSAKHPQSRYLAPSLGLAGLVWAAVFVAMSRAQLLRLTARTVWVGRLAAVVAACTLAIHQVALYRLSDRNSRERGRLSQLISGQREGARIFYYGASSPAYALIFGTSFSGQQYFRIIEKLIESGTCQTYLFNNWTGEFYSLRGPVTFDQIAAGGGPILLHGDVLSEPERAKLPAGVTLHELARAGDETIHELRRSQQQAAVGQAP